jgi:hypothetical protein
LKRETSRVRFRGGIPYAGVQSRRFDLESAASKDAIRQANPGIFLKIIARKGRSRRMTMHDT